MPTSTEQMTQDSSMRRYDEDAYFIMSTMRLHTGSPHEAAALLEAAERRYHDNSTHQQAWYKLQRGIIAMSSGQFERARALFYRALKIMPDWWLAQEHLAEVSVYLGDTQTAMQMYDKVIAATGYAEFLTARAELLLQSGQADAANADLVAARAQFDARMALYPEAVAGHAVDFYLQHGPADRALALAEADYQRRPYGEAATKLAEAWLQNRRAQDAVDLLHKHINAGWQSADAHYVLATAYGVLGQPEASRQHQQQALLLNPGAVVMLGEMATNALLVEIK
jgi:Tfp pilus assembly protein PilF